MDQNRKAAALAVAEAINKPHGFYVEARVGSANHRGSCCRFICGNNYNSEAENVIQLLVEALYEPDDDEPLTIEWLKEKKIPHNCCSKDGGGFRLWNVIVEWEITSINGTKQDRTVGIAAEMLPTRGHVRRLYEAFGKSIA